MSDIRKAGPLLPKGRAAALLMPAFAVFFADVAVAGMARVEASDAAAR